MRFRIKVLWTISILPLIMTSVIALGYDSSETKSWKLLKRMRSDSPETVAKISIFSANELEINGVRCRLFGIKPPKEPAQQRLAKRFLELYVSFYGNYFAIYNADSPVSDSEKVPLIWYQGIGDGGWAQETLVQAGLAEVDYYGYENYRFTTPTKSGTENYDWKKIFKDALAVQTRNAKPRIHFTWPEGGERSAIMEDRSSGWQRSRTAP